MPISFITSVITSVISKISFPKILELYQFFYCQDYNTVTNWTLSTAENTAHKAVEIAKPYATPIITQLKEPIQKVDGLLCTGLDYVEEKVPAVKLPPGEVSIILMLVSNINSRIFMYIYIYINCVSLASISVPSVSSASILSVFISLACAISHDHQLKIFISAVLADVLWCKRPCH